jgi:hypothetical protein
MFRKQENYLGTIQTLDLATGCPVSSNGFFESGRGNEDERSAV